MEQCPVCQRLSVITYHFIDETGKHKHPYYQCTFWKSDETRPCGWGRFVSDI